MGVSLAPVAYDPDGLSSQHPQVCVFVVIHVYHGFTFFILRIGPSLYVTSHPPNDYPKPNLTKSVTM